MIAELIAGQWETVAAHCNIFPSKISDQVVGGAAASKLDLSRMLVSTLCDRGVTNEELAEALCSAKLPGIASKVSASSCFASASASSGSVFAARPPFGLAEHAPPPPSSQIHPGSVFAKALEKKRVRKTTVREWLSVDGLWQSSLFNALNKSGTWKQLPALVGLSEDADVVRQVAFLEQHFAEDDTSNPARQILTDLALCDEFGTLPIDEFFQDLAVHCNEVLQIIQGWQDSTQQKSEQQQKKTRSEFAAFASLRDWFLEAKITTSEAQVDELLESLRGQGANSFDDIAEFTTDDFVKCKFPLVLAKKAAKAVQAAAQ